MSDGRHKEGKIEEYKQKGGRGVGYIGCQEYCVHKDGVLDGGMGGRVGNRKGSKEGGNKHVGSGVQVHIQGFQLRDALSFLLPIQLISAVFLYKEQTDRWRVQHATACVIHHAFGLRRHTLFQSFSLFRHFCVCC